MNDRVKKRKHGAEAKETSIDQLDTPKRRLTHLLEKLMPCLGTPSTMFADIITNHSLTITGGYIYDRVDYFPEFYLPPGFERALVDKVPIILFEKRFPVKGRNLERLNAVIKASAVGGKGYYYDKKGGIVIVPRSYNARDGIYFEASKSNHLEWSKAHALLILINSFLMTTTQLASRATLDLIGAIRVSVKGGKPEALAKALSDALNPTTLAEDLVTALSSEVKKVPYFASLILACTMTDSSREDILDMAERGQIDTETLYTILKAGDFHMPIRAFTNNHGLDNHGNPLRSVKLSDCDTNDRVVTLPKGTDLKYFKTLHEDLPVFIVPMAGVWRQEGMKDKKPNLKLCEVDSIDVDSLRLVEKALRGSSGPKHAARGEEEKEEEYHLSDIEGELSDSADDE